MLVTLDELEAESDRHNRAERARELHASLGWKWRLAGPAATEEAGFYSPAHLAGVSLPWRLEPSHTLPTGTTRTGQTVALRQPLPQPRPTHPHPPVLNPTR